ncbi:MAG: valine--tRNA ligase [Candidatus Micrarchaeia archaeon]
MLDNYDKAIEAKWQKIWEEQGIYRFDERDTKRPIYSIDSPPPFTSGDLHMGHVLSYAYFDFVARFKRMRGFNVYYPQGWDCQGFPTEVKVEAKFGRGLPPEEFRRHCTAWTHQYIARMRSQMVSMGYSPDWRFEYRTMDPDYHRRVQYSLIKMYEAGLIYRGEHPVFWCTNCRSAIAKAETEELERETTLNYIRFTIAETGRELPIATTRPELLHALVAVFVHPDDVRHKELIGKRAVSPFGKEVPIMADRDVDMNFGTGAVMVCTFGDKADVVWAYRHKLPIIRAMDEAGRLMNAGPYDGLKVEEANKKILEDLVAAGKLLKREPLKQVIKIHDRCKKPIEFLLSKQWFARLKGFEKEIIDAAKSMRWVPEYTISYLIDWANYIEWDWVISRQRVFGTPLPFWNCEACGKSFPASYEELPVYPASSPPRACPHCGATASPETSTCDCWVDSSITPLIIARWPDDKDFFARIYPASLRPQGTEIIRTWAFYTIYRCLKLTGKPPFRELLLHGNVLAPDGKKMSKSLGNIIPPDALIQQYSADAVRQWAALSGVLGKDRPFSYKDIAFAQSFINKLWNAARFVERALEGYAAPKKRPALRPVDKWILGRLNALIKATTAAYEAFDFYAAITGIHEFFWHEFCDFYLEEVKHRLYAPDVYGKESKLAAQYTLRTVLLVSLKLLAPIAVFVTEELYTALFAASEGCKSIHLSAWPSPLPRVATKREIAAGEFLKAILTEVRRFKSERKMALNQEVSRLSISAPREQLALLPLIEEELRAAGRVKEITSSEGAFAVSVSA